MASEGGNAGRTDPAWAYCDKIPGNKNGTICKFCGLMIQSGGITRFKYHLSHSDPQKNARSCVNVPPEVKKEISLLLKEKDCAKKKKAAKMDDIRAELRKDLYDEGDGDDSDDEEDMIMYPGDLDPAERKAYRAAARASKAAEWERQQMHNFTTSRRGGSTSKDIGGPSSQFRRTKSGRESNYERAPCFQL